MITYISRDNANKYNILFQKASDALGLSEDKAITTLNEYFAYLEELVKVSDKEDVNRFFARLPLDEEFFDIDANSRSIKIPSSFSRYGVGVQGDELAEVVYFKIARFFDATDLASDDINIIIQWEAKNEQKEVIAGISQHFGKDLETDPGSIIFGWPISHELTDVPGSIKFAVRFYQLGEQEEDNRRKLLYSFSTLPAEIHINASLDYDVVNLHGHEIDYGQIITSRVRKGGIYDTTAPIPQEPVITIPLYVMSPEGNELIKIVDLPAEEGSMIKLAVSARNVDFGQIGYVWNKFAYLSESGEYEKNGVPFESDGYIYQQVVYPERITKDQEYYTVIFSTEQPELVLSASLVAEDRIFKSNGESYVDTDNECYRDNNGNEIVLYKKLSIASITTVGEYSVDISARYGANSVYRIMKETEKIRVPGPKKPSILLPEETDNISITTNDSTVHAISDNGEIVLTAIAKPGETGLPASEVGDNPQVVLNFIWKEEVNGVGVDLSNVAAPGDITFNVIPAENINWTGEYGEANNELAKTNQSNVSIIQNGNNAVAYINGELNKYISSDPGQAQLGAQSWIGIDINTKKDSIIGLKWGENYIIGQTDVDDAESLDLPAGHIVFWARAEAAPYTISIGEPVYNEETGETEYTYTQLSMTVDEMPNDHPTYEFSTEQLDNGETVGTMTIVGLNTSGLDRSYYYEVEAVRNKVSTFDSSGIYRVTNSPEKPILLQANGDPVTRSIIQTQKQRKGVYQSLSFQTTVPEISDKITYLWMHADLNDDSDQNEFGETVVRIDLGGALSNILNERTNFDGNNDTICDSAVAHYETEDPTNVRYENNDIIFSGESGSSTYQLSASDSGLYYCIVINEVNNNKAASVSPFFYVF